MKQRKILQYRPYYDELQEARKTFDDSDNAILGPMYEYKSHYYQYKYKEGVGYSREHLEDLINKSTEPDDKSDEYFDLIEKLYIEVVRVMKEKFTLVQRVKINLRFMEGLTSKAVGETLGTTQISAYKTLYGDDKGHRKTTKSGIKIYLHVGLLERLQKYCAADEKIIDILHQLDTLKHQI